MLSVQKSKTKVFVTLRQGKKKKRWNTYSLSQALTLTPTVTLSPNHYTTSNFGKPGSQFRLMYTMPLDTCTYILNLIILDTPYSCHEPKILGCHTHFWSHKCIQLELFKIAVQMHHHPLVASDEFLHTYLCESIKWLYSSGMQQQPGSFTLMYQFLTDIQTFV